MPSTITLGDRSGRASENTTTRFFGTPPIPFWRCAAALCLCVAAVACSNSHGNAGASGSNAALSGSQAASGDEQNVMPSSGSPSSGQSGQGGAGTSSGVVAATTGLPIGGSGSGSTLDAGSVATAPEAGQPEASVQADGGLSSTARFACPAGPFPTPVAGPAQNVCADFQFKYNWNEGPTWITSQQAFFFSNFVHGTSGPGDIIKYTPGVGCETWVSNVGCNGLTAAFDGSLVGVCQTPRAVMSYDVVTKQPKMLAGMYMGQLLDSPNDVAATSIGAIYFSNPTYELGPRPVGVGPSFFYIDPTGALNLIIKDMSGQPNGVAVSPDERTLYLEWDGAGVKTYDLDSNGVPSNGPKDFAGTTDGMSVDCAGNLYLSGGSIIAPSGKQIGNYPGGIMAAFGGADGETILVVGSGTGLHTVQMNVPGPPH